MVFDQEEGKRSFGSVETPRYKYTPVLVENSRWNEG